ncbi:MAG: arginase family protein [Desulfacinum sp.]|nr:arginase family protein [Desulfacinum sp.]MBZ4660146.1 arginase [Desulfacinum sp.]
MTACETPPVPEGPDGAPPFGPPFPTFGGVRPWHPGSGAALVVMGVPYDAGTTNRPGTRFGPRAVREASWTGPLARRPDFIDRETGRPLALADALADAGDVWLEHGSLERDWIQVTRAVRLIRQAGAVPVTLGGDHSITYPVLRAFGEEPVHYVHLDTHVDCDTIFPTGWTHGSPVARIHQDGLARSLTLLGIRGLTNSGHDVAWIREAGATVIPARELRRLDEVRLAERLPRGPFYVSVDVDFFDPAVAPGTGTPEPGGLFFPHFQAVVSALLRRGPIVGFDVVEVSPILEGPHGKTARLAACCVLELAAAVLSRSKDAPNHIGGTHEPVRR